jgi:hypothetical protein
MSMGKPLFRRDLVLHFVLGRSAVRGVLRMEAEQAPLSYMGEMFLSGMGRRIEDARAIGPLDARSILAFPYAILDARGLEALDHQEPRPTSIRLDFGDGRSFGCQWNGARSYELREWTLSPRGGGTLFWGFRPGDSMVLSVGHESPEPWRSAETAFHPLWSERVEVARWSSRP